jgi:hypothetical protein
VLGFHVLEAASFDKVQLLADERAVWWFTEDIGILINLDDDNVKPKPEDSFDAMWGDDDDNNDEDNMDYSVFLSVH